MVRATIRSSSERHVARVGALVRPGVVALPPDPHEVVEAAVVAEAVAYVERCVHNTHRQVSSSGEDLR
jgi:hypothetical protein